ncbi:MAG: methyltransferase domain-containing protein [Deltaproteobacteria bacterium]|nr:methyltransferase domain-containing protein [Deltaproteobacteria bacterium]
MFNPAKNRQAGSCITMTIENEPGRTGHIVMVDGYSTGAYYLPLLREKGLPVVHVRSASVASESTFGRSVDQILERTKRAYAACFDEGPDMADLVLDLNPWQPMSVLVGCETGVELADELAHALGLPGNDPATSPARRDKFLMHQALARAGVRSLKSHMTDDLSDLLAWVRDEGGLPVVLKPPKSAAADGVHICRTEEEIRRAFLELKQKRTIFGSTLDQILAQEFALGSEVVVNTVSCQGRHRVSDLWRYSKAITPEGRSVYDAAWLVQDFGPETDHILDYARSVLDALDIGFGPAHAEIMLTAHGPVLIECGARPMGGSFPQDMVRDCLGSTQLDLALMAALEPGTFLARLDEPYAVRKHFCVKCLISSRKGALDATPAVSLLTALPSARGGNFLHCLEDGHVDCTVDLLSSPAMLFLCHENQELVRQDHELVRDLESEGQNLLFELSPGADLRPDPDWVRRVPDELWLKSEEVGAPDADIIWQALGLRSGMEVLDCPCGDGRVGIHLARRGVSLTGVDLNPRFVDRARQRFVSEGFQAEFKVCDMRALTFENRFDAVVNWFNSFGYFDVETDFEVLKNLARALKPGGLLLVEAPSRTNVLANTTAKFDAHGREIGQRWDELAERMFLPVPVEEIGRIVEVVSGPRLYTLAQYRLLFRLAGLVFVAAKDENLDTYGDHSHRMVLVARKPSINWK